ncbi:MAG TPA: YceD family protein, partial [Hyphomicrobiaceae bacterium]|nr:YceD family protein [Hyphomicrobiaceae bacterium]
ELIAVARALGLIACTNLQVHYAIQPMSGGRYRLSGRFHAEVTQACVVTLDPIGGTLEENFEATFWPREAMPVPESGELTIDDAPEPEPIIAGQIAVGRVVFESLAAALEPYPRKPGAVLDWQPPLAAEAAATTATSPFAVLANLKTKG